MKCDCAPSYSGCGPDISWHSFSHVELKQGSSGHLGVHKQKIVQDPPLHIDICVVRAAGEKYDLVENGLHPAMAWHKLKDLPFRRPGHLVALQSIAHMQVILCLENSNATSRVGPDAAKLY